MSGSSWKKIDIPQGMEVGLNKRYVPQQKEISKERRVCDIIGKQKKRAGLKRRSILEQDFDSARTRKRRAAHN